MVDFQLSHYNSFAYDILYLFTSSVQLRVLDKKWNELINAYQEELESTLLRYGGFKAPSIQQIEDEIGRKIMHCLFISCTILPVLLKESDGVVPLEKVIEVHS